MVNIDPHKLFYRFVIERKGSYCLGHNSLFLGVLRGLGYRAYHVAARVNDDRVPIPAEFASLTHLLTLVQPHPDSNVTYLVDVGFGTGPVCPILLSDPEKSIVLGANPTERFRLRRRKDPRSSLESRTNGYTISGQNWALEVQHLKDRTTAVPSTTNWTPLYLFSEEEVYPPDIIDASFVVSRGWIDNGRFRKNVIAIRYFFLDDDNDDNDNDDDNDGDGDNNDSDDGSSSRRRLLILDPDKTEAMKTAPTATDDFLKRHLGQAILMGNELRYRPYSETIITLKTERERIRVLEDIFGIVIRGERDAI